MNNFKRLLLLAVALAVGALLGYLLLLDFEPIKISIFAVACVVLGEVFSQIDKKISKK